MKNLVNFIIKYHFFLLFVIFEFISVLLVVQFNYYHKASFINASNSVTGSIYKNFSHITEYLSLRYQNDHLIKENLYLKNILSQEIKSGNLNKENIHLTNNKQYIYHSAKIIYNSVDKIHNYLIIDKGSDDGISIEMAVITSDGVVGVVKETSKHYATVISLLNQRFKIGAKIKDSNFYGSVSWDGIDYTSCTLNEIPRHAIVNIGDTVVTSGYSAIFPENMLIGVISDYYLDDSYSFYNIHLKLINDFKKVYHVYVVENKRKEEILNLMNTIND